MNVVGDKSQIAEGGWDTFHESSVCFDQYTTINSGGKKEKKRRKIY